MNADGERQGSHQKGVGERIFSICVFTPCWAWGEKEEEEGFCCKDGRIGLVVFCHGTERVKAQEKKLQKNFPQVKEEKA